MCGATQERQTVFKYIAEGRVDPAVQLESSAETKYQKLELRKVREQQGCSRLLCKLAIWVKHDTGENAKRHVTEQKKKKKETSLLCFFSLDFSPQASE